MRARSVVPVLVVVFVMLAGSIVSAAGPYPDQLPDFAHSTTPHQGPGPAYSPFSTFSGLTDLQPNTFRWLLVINKRFSDIPAVAEGTALSRFFPKTQFGTVAHYFAEVSSGAFDLRPAPEAGGVANDGVITVDLGPFAAFNAKSAQDQNGTVLNAADPFVDFAYFDSIVGGGDNNGTVDWRELTIVSFENSQAPNDFCASTRDIPAGKTLDEKSLQFTVANGKTLTNMMTFAHELGHVTLGLAADFYNIGIREGLGGPTCTSNMSFSFYPNAYERLHWGWRQSIVVTKDGFYSVGNGSTVVDGPITTHILYDPAKGEDHYFLVENRQAIAGTYDQSVSDSGLYIWRVQDSAYSYNLGGTSPQFLQLMTPNTMNSAWDPSDSTSPQRTMTGMWFDGTASSMAVRAIRSKSGPFNDVIAYFDVRGPGVLVDPTTAQGALIRPSVPIGGTVNVSFPVMNTGEATDTFDFTILVPTGWSATTQRMTLSAGQQATATIAVTAASDAAVGFRTVVARGRSTTDSNISTDVEFFVDVTRRSTTVDYTGPISVEYSDPVTLTASVTDTLSAAPLAGRTVTFTLGTQTATAATDANGVASATLVVTQQPDVWPVVATVPASATHAEATDSDVFVIDEEDLTLTITSPLLQPLAGSSVINIQATEENDGSPGDLTLATLQVTLQPMLTATPYTQQVTLDSGGTATATFTGLPSDVWSVSVAVVQDFFEAPALTAELVVFDPAAKIGGYASGPDQTGERVKLTPVISYSGTTAVGTIEMQSKPHKFKPTQVRWVVVAGARALVEAVGEYNGIPAVLRADITDSGLSGGQGDHFTLRITSPAGTLLYQSGNVTRENGNVVVSSTR